MAEPTGETGTDVDDARSTEHPADDEYRRGHAVGVHHRNRSRTVRRRAAARRPVVTGFAAGTGRRKEAIARVRISPERASGRSTAGRWRRYFPNKVHQQLVNEPFVTLGAEDKFDVVARISGGGVTGQAGALRLGVTRALILVDPENRPALKKAGFVTRDARVKERKKYGLKKARKAPQYSKR